MNLVAGNTVAVSSVTPLTQSLTLMGPSQWQEVEVEQVLSALFYSSWIRLGLLAVDFGMLRRIWRACLDHIDVYGNLEIVKFVRVRPRERVPSELYTVPQKSNLSTSEIHRTANRIPETLRHCIAPR